MDDEGNEEEEEDDEEEEEEEEEDNDDAPLLLSSSRVSEPVYTNPINARDAAALGSGGGTSNVTRPAPPSRNELLPSPRHARKNSERAARTKRSALRLVAPSPLPMVTVQSGGAKVASVLAASSLLRLFLFLDLDLALDLPFLLLLLLSSSSSSS